MADQLDIFASVRPPTLSVTEFVDRINQTLEEQVGTTLVEGEVSQPRRWKERFLFFDLKDETSVVSCFAVALHVGTVLEDGMHVRVLGLPKLRGQSGRFSLTVEAIELVGEGALRRAYELLLGKLRAEGLFAPEHKQPLPRFPHRIGLITSADGAALGDVRRVLTERWGNFTLALCPVSVQGMQAVPNVLAALETFNAYEPVDVILLTRGGGSMEDLAAFNDERMARAIFASRIPIIAAIGHEQDVTIAELVADARAATPSNAAQLAVPDRTTIALELEGHYRHAMHTLERRLRHVSELLEAGTRILTERLVTLRNRLDRFSHAIQLVGGHVRHRVVIDQQRLARSGELASSHVQAIFERLSHRVRGFEHVTTSLSPKLTFKRGYSFTTLKDSGRVVTNAQDAPIGTLLQTHLYQGRLESEVLDGNQT